MILLLNQKNQDHENKLLLVSIFVMLWKCQILRFKMNKVISHTSPTGMTKPGCEKHHHFKISFSCGFSGFIPVVRASYAIDITANIKIR